MISYKNILILDHLEENMTSKTCRESLFCWCFYVQNQFGSQKNKFIHLAMENEAGLEQKQNNWFRIYIVRNFGLPLSLGSHIWKCLTQ